MSEILKDCYYILLVVLGVWVAFYIGLRHDTLDQRMTRYDCNLVESNSTIPNDIVNECRRRKIESINNRKD